MKSEGNDSDTQDNKLTTAEAFATSISVTNANIFLIADKKSTFFNYKK